MIGLPQRMPHCPLATPMCNMHILLNHFQPTNYPTTWWFACRWERRELVEGLLALVRRAAGGITFPLTSALMRHAAAPGLPARTRATVVRFAVEQGAVYPLSALSLALSELPPALAVVGGGAAVVARGGNGVVGREGEGEGADLTRAVHEAVAGLSRQVADAGQVAEALAVALKGHAAAAAAASPAGLTAPAAGPNQNQAQNPTLPGAVAVLVAGLDVGVVALRELPSLGEGGRHFPGRTVPASLLHVLTPLILGAGAQGPLAAAVAAGARTLLAAALPSIGGQLRDEKQAVHLAQLARALLLMGGGNGSESDQGPPSPEMFATADQYLDAVVGCGKPAALLAAAHVGLQAAGSVTDGTSAPPGPGSARTDAATMLLCCALARRMAAAAQCPQLLQRCKDCDGAAWLAPELHLADNGKRGGVRLQATSPTWGPPSSAAAAASSSSTGPGLAAAAIAWRAAFKTALCESGVLVAEFGAALPGLLDQQLPPPSLPATGGVGLGSAGLLSPASHHPTHGRTLSQGLSGGGSVGFTSPGANGAQEPGTGASGGGAGGSSQGANGLFSQGGYGSGGESLQARLAQQAWGVRAATLRRERLNLARVMDLLGPGEGEGSDTEGGEPGAGGAGNGTGAGGADAVAALLASPTGVNLNLNVQGGGGRGEGGGPRGCVSVDEVLAVVAAAEAEGVGKGRQRVGPQLLQLAQELEPCV